MAEIERHRKLYPSDLTDAEWERIAPLLPPPRGRGRKLGVDLREVVNAVSYMALRRRSNSGAKKRLQT